MKKTFPTVSLLALILAVTAVTPASAQNARHWMGSLGGGFTLPSGDAGDRDAIGYHASGMLGYHRDTSKATWLVDASFHRFDEKHLGTIGKTENALVVMGRVNYVAAGHVYLLGALGLVSDKYSQRGPFSSSPSTPVSASGLAVSGGAGFTFKRSLFAEARVIHLAIKESSSTLIPFTIGVRF